MRTHSPDEAPDGRPEPSPLSPHESATPQDRREFLKKCGKYAVLTPPAIALLLSLGSTPAHASPSLIPGIGDSGHWRRKFRWWQIWKIFS